MQGIFFLLAPPMKIELTECSNMLAHKIHMAGSPKRQNTTRNF